MAALRGPVTKAARFSGKVALMDNIFSRGPQPIPSRPETIGETWRPAEPARHPTHAEPEPQRPAPRVGRFDDLF